MALQGDLASFALPEVLRLLAGTGKSGRLTITADGGEGDVWMHEGRLVCGSITTAAHAVEPADVVFELLRFGGGAFSFDDDDQLEQVDGSISVDKALNKAEALVAQWEELEEVVPSVHARFALREELDADEIIISAADWRTLAAVGDAATARRIGDHFEVTDLVACTMIRSLVDAGLVAFDGTEDQATASASDTFGGISFDDDPYAAFQRPEPAPGSDPYAVFGDSGTVLLESHADALLPEPLPGEGTSFAADLDDPLPVTAAYDAPAPIAAPAPPPPVSEVPPVPVAALAAAPEPVAFESAFGVNGSEQAGWGDDELAALRSDDFAPGAFDTSPFTSPGALPADDDDRGSLMKFLSTVKP